MTIKTPEQIAAEVFKASNWFQVEDRHEFMDAMVAAIEADRAQHQHWDGEIYIVQNDAGDVVDAFWNADEARAALDALHEWAVSVSYFLSTDKCNGWSEELDALVKIEREHGLVDDDGELTSTEGQVDYGQYLDQQFWGDRD